MVQITRKKVAALSLIVVVASLVLFSVGPFWSTMTLKHEFTVADDGYAMSTSAGSSYGGSSTLSVGSSPLKAHRSYAFFKFDLSWLPPEAKIINMVLKTNILSVTGSGGNYKLGLSLNNGWSSSSLTWNNAPALTSTTFPPAYAISGAGWREWNEALFAMTINMHLASDKRVTFVMFPDITSTGALQNTAITVASQESSTPAILTVTYTVTIYDLYFRVQDVNGNPISGATLTFDDYAGYKLTTNSSGYVYAPLPSTTFHVTASYSGKQSQQQTIVLNHDMTVTFTLAAPGQATAPPTSAPTNPPPGGIVAPTFSVNIYGAGSLTVAQSPPYTQGETLSLQATANSGWSFSHWNRNGNPDSSDNPHDFSDLQSGEAFVAVFANQPSSPTPQPSSSSNPTGNPNPTNTPAPTATPMPSQSIPPASVSSTVKYVVTDQLGHPLPATITETTAYTFKGNTPSFVSSATAVGGLYSHQFIVNQADSSFPVTVTATVSVGSKQYQNQETFMVQATAAGATQTESVSIPRRFFWTFNVNQTDGSKPSGSVTLASTGDSVTVPITDGYGEGYLVDASYTSTLVTPIDTFSLTTFTVSNDGYFTATINPTTDTAISTHTDNPNGVQSQPYIPFYLLPEIYIYGLLVVLAVIAVIGGIVAVKRTRR